MCYRYVGRGTGTINEVPPVKYCIGILLHRCRYITRIQTTGDEGWRGVAVVDDEVLLYLIHRYLVLRSTWYMQIIE